MENENSQYKQTPFACHKDDITRYDAVKPNTTVQNIRSLFERRMLSDKDTQLLDAFRKYTYLNSYLVLKIMEQTMLCNSNYVKNMLQKLLRCGLITRFRVHHTDSYGKQHASSYIYCFSERGRKLFGIKNMEQEIPPRSKTVYSYLAFNQFYLAMIRNYAASLNNYVYCIGHPAYDGKVQLSSSGIKITMHIMVIRQAEGWKENMISRLRWQKNSTACHMILILCETELQALEAENLRKKEKELESYTVCYLCDQATKSETYIFDHLIRVDSEKGKNYEICSIPVDNTLKLTECDSTATS